MMMFDYELARPHQLPSDQLTLSIFRCWGGSGTAWKCARFSTRTSCRHRAKCTGLATGYRLQSNSFHVYAARLSCSNLDPTETSAKDSAVDNRVASVLKDTAGGRTRAFAWWASRRKGRESTVPLLVPCAGLARHGLAECAGDPPVATLSGHLCRYWAQLHGPCCPFAELQQRPPAFASMRSRPMPGSRSLRQPLNRDQQVWYIIFRHGLDHERVGSSHQLVVTEGQWWRALTASFSHISLVHLGFNMMSTWQLKTAETMLGAAGYLRMTFVFLLSSILIQQALHAALAKQQRTAHLQHTIGVGFSCVVFAWMTWLSLKLEGQALDFVFFRVPYSLSPFASLVLTQVIIPRVDFVGHLSGILAGYWQGWGLNQWLTDYWLLQTGVWMLLAVMISWLQACRPLPPTVPDA